MRCKWWPKKRRERTYSAHEVESFAIQVLQDLDFGGVLAARGIYIRAEHVDPVVAMGGVYITIRVEEPDGPRYYVMVRTRDMLE